MFCFLLTGHKPEGGEKQPGAALSVQRGQAVEAAAGRVTDMSEKLKAPRAKPKKNR